MKVSCTVTTTNGKEFVSGWRKVSKSALKDLEYVCKNIVDMETISLETSKGEVFFNPKHVVSILITKK